MRTTRPRSAAYYHDRPNYFAASFILSLVARLLQCTMMRGGTTALCPTPPANNAKRARAAAATASSLRRSPSSSFITASNGPTRQPPLGGRQRRAAAPRSPAANSSSDDDHAPKEDRSPRSKLRRITGFSLTALRATLRSATGFSLTALRAALRTATGISLSGTISNSVRRVLDVLSPSLRYFLQPLLIAYYVPLLTVRYWLVGPNRAYVEEGRAGHERIVESWRKAVEAAEKANAGGYWPVHLNGKSSSIIFGFWSGGILLLLGVLLLSSSRHSSLPFFCFFHIKIKDDGTITTSLPPDVDDDDVVVVDLADGIERSVAVTTATETFAAR